MNKTLLTQKINESRKSGNNIAKMAYQYVLSAVQALEGRENRELKSEEIEKVIVKEVRSLSEMVEKKTAHNNEDKMIEILNTLLPAKVSLDQYEEIANTAITVVSAVVPKDMGRVMAEIKQKYGNTIDTKTISEIVKGKLNK